MTTYPWHQEAFRRLQAIKQQQRLPNALLLTGVEKIGKLVLAQRFIALLLCENTSKDEQACGVCHTCQNLLKDDLTDEFSQEEGLIRQSYHPSVIYCRPELKKKNKMSEVVRIDQVRAFCQALYKTSDQLKIGLVWYGDQFNAYSADSLLKTLEEPPENTLIILLTHQKSRLPQTIISRCQTITLVPSYDKTTIDWLTGAIDSNKDKDINIEQLLLANYGAPLAVIDMINHNQHQYYQAWYDYFINIAQKSSYITQAMPSNKQADILLGLSCLRDLLILLIRLKLEKKQSDIAILNVIVSNSKSIFLLSLLEDIQRAIYLSHTSINLSLLFGNLLIIWSHITHLVYYPKLYQT